MKASSEERMSPKDSSSSEEKKNSSREFSRQSSEANFDHSDETIQEVKDVRDEIRSMLSETARKLSTPMYGAKGTNQIRPSTPYSRNGGRRSHTSSIAPSGSGIERGASSGNLANRLSFDIWAKTRPFFKEIATEEEIKRKLATTHFDEHPTIEKKENWTVTLQKAVDAFRSANPATFIENPPNAKYNKKDINKYWKSHVLPSEYLGPHCIKENQSKLHCMMSAYIDEKPPPDLPKIKREKPLRILAPAPQIEYCGYCSLSFEQRLETELEAIGMGDIGSEDDDCGVFVSDMALLRAHAEQNIPIIEAFREDVLENAEKMRSDFKKHADDEAEFQKLSSVALTKRQGKSHKRTVV